MTTSAILLAAGESRRMGTPKPLLPWLGTTLVAWQARQLLEAGVDYVIVVTGHRGEVVAAEVKRLVPAPQDKSQYAAPQVIAIRNPDFALGKTTSIKSGLSAVPQDARTIVLLAVDQPRPAEVTRQMLASHRKTGALISSPRYEGHGGHPLVFDASLKSELAAISEEQEGLREVMRRHANEINWVLFDRPVVRMDMNTPEEYEAVHRAFTAS